ncbi:MAG: hypothetical protein ISS34_01750 [Candidatus Omnitrophica bacterium]|nr:hypothetical protein [Candidatus Omnitrophota bacterium]
MKKRAGQDYSLVAVGDRADFDALRKLHKEKKRFSNSRVAYYAISYKRLLEGNTPKVKTKDILFFLFFPFDYWNRYIEPARYKGIYGNKKFYKKFDNFFKRVESTVRKSFKGKRIHYINSPRLSAGYRDKLAVKRLMLKKKVPTPRLYNVKGLRALYNHLSKGRSFFLKPRYGSMGKGITYISPRQWKTNFLFRNNRVLSRKSDYGWRFRDITGKDRFIEKLFNGDFYMEDAVDFLTLKGKKFDLRIYVFFGKALFIYPKSSDPDDITTNISQSGAGEYAAFLRPLPKSLIRRAEREAIAAAKSAGLNFAGVDIIIDEDMKNIYVLDINVFPGFPRKRIFNLAKHLTRHFKELPPRKIQETP